MRPREQVGEATAVYIRANYCCSFQRRLDNGSLAKVKLDNTGSVHTLYEQDLQKNTKLAFSAHFDATNLEAAPKIGVAVDVKN